LGPYVGFKIIHSARAEEIARKDIGIGALRPPVKDDVGVREKTLASLSVDDDPLPSKCSNDRISSRQSREKMTVLAPSSTASDSTATEV
jgi:hypothetical protein